MKRLTIQQFVERARKAHGDKYDYSKVEYINNSTKVCIVCPTHGEFWQKPNNHFQGKGCRDCQREVLKSLVCGVGINDLKCSTGNKKMDKSYITWRGMIVRCYDEKYRAKYPSYKGCSVCNEWLLYSNFKKWFDENYIEGNVLDKDLSQHGVKNKIYSPSTCNFVTPLINAALTKSDSKRGDFIIGAHKNKDGNFVSMIDEYNNRVYLGVYFSDVEAYLAYKTEKERYLKEIADKEFKAGKITDKVRTLLYQYEVKTDD